MFIVAFLRPTLRQSLVVGRRCHADDCSQQFVARASFLRPDTRDDSSLKDLQHDTSSADAFGVSTLAADWRIVSAVFRVPTFRATQRTFVASGCAAQQVAGRNH